MADALASQLNSTKLGSVTPIYIVHPVPSTRRRYNMFALGFVADRDFIYRESHSEKWRENLKVPPKDTRTQTEVRYTFKKMLDLHLV